MAWPLLRQGEKIVSGKWPSADEVIANLILKLYSGSTL